MNEVAFVGKTFLKSIAASANIFLLAQTMNMPLKNIERLIKFSPYTVFLFLFVYALSSVDGIVPALIGTVLYVIIEMDALMGRSVMGEDNNQIDFLRSTGTSFA